MQRFKLFVSQPAPDGQVALQPINPVVENAITHFFPGSLRRQGVRVGGSELRLEESLSAAAPGDPGGLSAHRIMELLLTKRMPLVIRQELLSKSGKLQAAYMYTMELAEVSGLSYDAAESRDTYVTVVNGVIEGGQELDVNNPLPGDPIPEDQKAQAQAQAPAAPQAPAQAAPPAVGAPDAPAAE